MKNGKLETHEIVAFILSKGWLSTEDLQRALGSYGIIKTDESVRGLRKRYEHKYVPWKLDYRDDFNGKTTYCSGYEENHFVPTLEQIAAFETEFNKHFPEEAPKEKWYHKIWAWWINLNS